ncbi:hypothetical protein H312_02186 [Anncaliia algerae PRA339]|uniref:Uncharacterized protein n=1 Tax=Anncaliia algerae PRA339 TaxID=1288291 RepID=A0A059EZD4_9MICR|nr:hypothetical protein H312_02186 [Anncaliia algerae PRA339]
MLKVLLKKNKLIVVNQGLKSIADIVVKIQNIEELEKQMFNLNLNEYKEKRTKEKYCKKHGPENHETNNCFYYKKKTELNKSPEKFQKTQRTETRNIKEDEKYFPTVRYNVHVNKEKFTSFLDSDSIISLISKLRF